MGRYKRTHPVVHIVFFPWHHVFRCIHVAMCTFNSLPAAQYSIRDGDVSSTSPCPLGALPFPASLWVAAVKSLHMSASDPSEKFCGMEARVAATLQDSPVFPAPPGIHALPHRTGLARIPRRLLCKGEVTDEIPNQRAPGSLPHARGMTAATCEDAQPVLGLQVRAVRSGLPVCT